MLNPTTARTLFLLLQEYLITLRSTSPTCRCTLQINRIRHSETKELLAVFDMMPQATYKWRVLTASLKSLDSKLPR